VDTADVQRSISPIPTLPRRHRALGLGLALALTAVGCGGSSSPEEQAARQISEALEGIDGLDGIEIEGLEELLEGGAGNISVQGEAGGMAMGTDLPRPEWLPAGFPLPEGSITATAIEADESSAGLWIDVPGTLAQVRADQVAALEAWGARLLTPRDEIDDASSLVFATPDDRTLRTGYGELGDRVAVTIEFTSEDVAVAEDAVAGPSESAGTATVVIDAAVFTAEGTCRFGPTYATFEAATGDTISISLQNDGTGRIGSSVSVTEISEDTMMLWLLTDLPDTDATFSPADGSIAVRGVFADLMGLDAEGGSSNNVPGSADVTCR
jgi:hypothetical protein